MLGIVVGLCTISVLVNPFGPALPRVWISLMGSSVIPKVIIEHARLSPLSPEGMMILLLAAGYVYVILGVLPRGLRMAWLLPAVWFLLALSRVRHGPLFAIVTALAIADMLPHHPAYQKLRSTITSFKPLIRRQPAVWPFGCVVFALFTVALCVQSAGWKLPVIGAGRCVATNDIWPVDAVAALKRESTDAERPVRVFNEMRFGGYLAYAAPSSRIYIDDRCELHRDEGLLRYIELQTYPERIAGEAERYGFDYALIRHGSRVCEYLSHNDDWLLMHRNDTAALFKAVSTNRRQSVAIAKPIPQR